MAMILRCWSEHSIFHDSHFPAVEIVQHDHTWARGVSVSMVAVHLQSELVQGFIASAARQSQHRLAHRLADQVVG
ncbi:MAG: hypothetical protein ACKO9Z_19080, partial [Planctomycetota bacterium]